MKLAMQKIENTGNTHSATVIFFHGSGDNGKNFIEWIRFLLGKNLEYPHIKLLFPTAPNQPYSPLGGQRSNVWYDRSKISIEARERRQSLAAIYEIVNSMIKNEIYEGIPANRIIVGGFSMGGGLALHTAYHINTKLKGAFAMSSFLCRESIVYESLNNRSMPGTPLPELLMFHGDQDALISIDWGKETFKKLKDFDVKGEFITLENTAHELKKKEIMKLNEWILKLLPPVESDLLNKL